MTKVLWIAAGIFAVLLLLSLAAGYYMFRFAVLRRSPKHDYWDKSTPLHRSAAISDADYALMSRGADYIKSYPYETVYIRSHDGLKLGGRIFETSREVCRGMFVLVHGYRSHAIYDFSCVVKVLLDEGFSCLLIDHRTEGLSEGKYIGFGVLERYDLVKWCEFLKERYPERGVILDGVSMGSSTVMMGCALGYPDNVRALICDCGYTTAAAICKRTLKRWFHLPAFPVYYTAALFVRMFAGYWLGGASAADGLRRNRLPTIIAHGKKDGFVPYEMSVENVAAGGENVVFFTSEEADHGMAFLCDRDAYMEEIRKLWLRAGV